VPGSFFENRPGPRDGAGRTHREGVAAVRYHKLRHFEELLDRKLYGVVVKKGSSEPRWQIYLVYEDDTYFEIYIGENDFSVSDGLREGGMEAVKGGDDDGGRSVVYEVTRDDRSEGA